jgi:hypothetical protein
MAPSGMSFNEFQRELKKRGIEGHMAIILTGMFEQMRSMAEQLDESSKIMLSLVDTVGNVVELHHATQGRVDTIRDMISGNVKGVEFNSVPLIDEPKDS